MKLFTELSSLGQVQRTRKRSILKYDSFEVADDTLVFMNEDHRPRRGVLKKDSSYDETLRPILKNTGSDYESAVASMRLSKVCQMNESVSSTSSEDLESLLDQNNRGFVDVVIDPVPKSVEQSSTSEDEDVNHHYIPSPRKASLGPRLPVIPPSSVKISADGNLAGKLQVLSGQAEAKMKQMAEAEAYESAIIAASVASKPPTEKR
jgi:hypothetical protein